MSVTIKLRKGLESEWNANSSIVLASGEPGLEIDTGRLKIGNGTTQWGSLQYASVVPTGILAGSGINVNLGSNGSTATISVSGSFVASTGNLDVLQLNTNIEPTLLQGQMAWNDTEGTVDIALTDTAIINIGEHTVYRVRNTTGGTLYKGQPVYASGVHANGIILPNLYAADGSIREIRFIGLIYENVDDNNSGYAVNFGHVSNIDTRGNVATNYAVGDETWLDGDILYVHPTVPGKLTKNEPKHSIAVAIILDAASNGKIFVRPTSYGHLEDNHDVAVSGATNGQFLQYNSSTDYWVPSSSGTFTILNVDNLRLDGNTLSSTSGIFIDPGNGSLIVYSGPTDVTITNGGNINTQGTVTAETINVNNLRLDGNTLSTTNTNGDLVINPSGNGALQRDSGGNARGEYAVDWQTVRSAGTMVANGNYSVIGGGSNNTSSGTNSTVGGGGYNTSSGSYCTVGGGNNNTSSGAFTTLGGGYSNTSIGTFATVGGGYSNTSSGFYSTVGGGANNTCSGDNSTVGGGNSNTSSGNYGSTVGGGNSNTSSGFYSTVGGGHSNTSSGNYGSTVGGGNSNTSSGNYSTIPGGLQGKATRYGEMSHSTGKFAANGDAQHTILVARRLTTDATANQVLFLDGSSALLIPTEDTMWTFEIKLSAYSNNNTDGVGAWWIFRGGIVRDNQPSIRLVGSVITESGADSALSSAGASVAADTSNESLEIRVTGVAGMNIRWVAVVDISQVSYGTP